MQPRCANSSQPTCRTIFAPVLHPYLSRTLHTSLLEHFGTQTGDRHQMSPDQNVWRGDKGSSKYSELTELTGIPAVPRRNWCNRCIDPLSIAALRGTKAPRHQGTKAPRQALHFQGCSTCFINSLANVWKRSAVIDSAWAWAQRGLPVDLYTNVFKIFNLVIWNILKCWTMKSMKYQDSLWFLHISCGFYSVQHLTAWGSNWRGWIWEIWEIREIGRDMAHIHRTHRLGIVPEVIRDPSTWWNTIWSIWWSLIYQYKDSTKWIAASCSNIL